MRFGVKLRFSVRAVVGSASAFVEWPSAPDDRTLGVVDFSIFPHLFAFPENTLADAERWAEEIDGPAYDIDEQTGHRRRRGRRRGGV